VTKVSTPTPRPRATVATIPAYVPGKPPVPRDGLQTYKLSSNENPYPPLPGVVEAVTAAAGQMNRYPDMGAVALYDALAAKLDVPAARIAAATGSVAVLYHLLQAYCDPGDEVVHAWRSFEADPIAASVVGARSVQVPLTADARHDLAAMAAAVTERTKVVLLCTPNNPTGPALTDAEVRAFVDRLRGDVLVVIDEAYREFVRLDDPLDGLALVRERSNVVVMRTFAKAYGLAGLRVGYLVGPEEVATAVRACSLPFGVSSVAQAAAVASLAAERELLERVDALVVERTRVVEALAAQGWELPEAQGNFVWFPLGDRALELAAAAEEAGVMVRPFAGDGVRVSIGEAEANDRLVAVAARFGPQPQSV
jgi:histidinol-phosphate aminotransferase